MTSIDVSQLNRLAAELDSQAPRIGRSGSAAVRAAAARVEKTAKELAPVDTGALRDSIGTDLYGTGNSRHFTAVVGPTVEYGRIVEFGFADNPPQAFMGPALDRCTPEFVAALERVAGQAFT